MTTDACVFFLRCIVRALIRHARDQRSKIAELERALSRERARWAALRAWFDACVEDADRDGCHQPKWIEVMRTELAKLEAAQ